MREHEKKSAISKQQLDGHAENLQKNQNGKMVHYIARRDF